MRLRSINFGALLLLLPLGLQASGVEKPVEIQEAAHNFLENYYHQRAVTNSAHQGETVSINVARLDPRLRLSKCAKPLTLKLQGHNNNGRNSVKVSCDTPKAWSVFISATASIKSPIVVATHNLARGSLLSQSSLKIEHREIHGSGRGYAREIARVLNKQLKRPLAQGEALRLASVIEPNAIKRGDGVMIEAQKGAISVHAPGTAMADGRVGQQISVRNNKSERVIKARIVGPGRVSVIL